jgi:hypothetical protein
VLTAHLHCRGNDLGTVVAFAGLLDQRKKIVAAMYRDSDATSLDQALQRHRPPHLLSVSNADTALLFRQERIESAVQVSPSRNGRTSTGASKLGY